MVLPYTNIMHPCCFVWSSDEITNVLFLLLRYGRNEMAEHSRLELALAHKH
jgi:hypothetical protein